MKKHYFLLLSSVAILLTYVQMNAILLLKSLKQTIMQSMLLEFSAIVVMLFTFNGHNTVVSNIKQLIDQPKVSVAESRRRNKHWNWKIQLPL